mmetsp:Transcript_6722/g.9188  ORF Transcript_6722/g.9188 Transcript_6722/m.9188 type:complete len:87 (-) Transcript_6722:1244-1504(-)
MTYSLLNERFETAPAFLSVSKVPGESKLWITVDARNVDKATTHKLYLRANLDNYPELAPFDHAFTLVVEEPEIYDFDTSEPEPEPV